MTRISGRFSETEAQAKRNKMIFAYATGSDLGYYLGNLLHDRPRFPRPAPVAAADGAGGEVVILERFIQTVPGFFVQPLGQLMLGQ